MDMQTKERLQAPYALDDNNIVYLSINPRERLGGGIFFYFDPFDNLV